MNMLATRSLGLLLTSCIAVPPYPPYLHGYFWAMDNALFQCALKEVKWIIAENLWRSVSVRTPPVQKS
ncbi:hypothetical protein C4564_03870 [Candidatus Microgenomates bacterium]|nr:MAG: hypothetical protein C4564_03870 [Candidatus Microgenomates bacterium]